MEQTTLDAEPKAHVKKDTASTKAKEEEFIKSCRPLKDMLDSVRDIEGCPIGKDEDILAQSDAPWYTACPNPYINEFINVFGKPYEEDTDDYERKPFVSDLSEGKNDPIYNAHSYHTKVPHKAIMKFIEHYTDEGDIVFDGFCGTAMTGVAAQLLNRKAVLSDLSPAATFIAFNYNTLVDVHEFEQETKIILAEVEKECGWMYETLHTDGKTKGRINYTVWSDVFICPYCNQEYVFWEAAVDEEEGKVNEEYTCPNCNANLTKRSCSRSANEYFDSAINQNVIRVKQVPVLINYNVGKKRYRKKIDENDLNLIKKIEESAIPYWFPTNRMPDGDESRRNDKYGITHVHHFYTKRNLWALSFLANRIQKFQPSAALNFMLTGILPRASLMHKWKKGQTTGITTGTLYVPSLIYEFNIRKMWEERPRYVKELLKMRSSLKYCDSIISTQSSASNYYPKQLNRLHLH